MRIILLYFFSLCSLSALIAQDTYPVNGPFDQRDDLYAFTKATIVVSHDQQLENATLLIRDGRIEAIGTNIRIPKDAVEVKLDGHYIYPSFIELYSNYGMPSAKPVEERPRQQPQMLSNKKGAFGWNEAIRPEFKAHEHFSANNKEAESLRNLGFGTVLTHKMDGISRGASSVVSLGNGQENLLVLKENAAHHLSFNKGTSTQNYPSSLMGAIALIRQTYYDAQWYKADGHKEEYNISLDTWNQLQKLPQIFEARDWAEALRASKIATEFNQKYIIKGGGTEYRRLDAMKALGTSFILPVDFPSAYDVQDPFDAKLLDIDDLKHWELAPTNPARMANAGISISLTTHGLEKKSSFFSYLRKAIESGLSKEDALKALTINPAEIIGMSNELGTLEKGKIANFIITSGDVFDKETQIYHNWIQGKPFIINLIDNRDISGKYDLQVADTTYSLVVSGDINKPEIKIIVNDSTSTKVKAKVNNQLLNLSFSPEGSDLPVRLSGAFSSSSLWQGSGENTEGQTISWRAEKTAPLEEESKEEEDEEEEEADKKLGEVTYPFLPFGWTEQPKQETIIIKNATVWTNEREGILRNTDVLVRNGKIAQITQNINVDIGTVIDGTNKHLTCGIIDEHSHIAISRGVNEGTQASSAEVSIADVVDSENINIYRQLSGGVTAAQLLHGSANPIGGQSGIIKMRWGWLPEEMKIKNTDPFIKFALGENVKQSNWGDNNQTRYPQTRMGVEQVFIDHFNRAQEYGKLKSSGKPYRKDLELEALLEIIESKRFITCHSYQQGEINMLMKVAERFGFKVNTFTHILEGYKVADKMAAHGAGGSSFSDWWAYKYEVIDAIPYNGALLHGQGVVTAFNSDDAEMARRLNQEAAKAVKYGDLSEEEAWKFVTLNPARLLHLDDRMGSIKVGKDADLVLWSDNPLSVYAMAEITFVDGRKLFDREQDKVLREELSAEKARLISKMLNDDGKGKKRAPRGKKEKLYHCDDIEEEIK